MDLLIEEVAQGKLVQNKVKAMRAAPALLLYFFDRGIPVLDIFPDLNHNYWVLKLILNFRSMSEGCCFIAIFFDACICLRRILSWKLCNPEDVAWT